MESLFPKILEILAENGETRTLTLLKLTNQNLEKIKIQEPLVFEYDTSISKNIIFSIHTSGHTKNKIDWGDGNTDYYEYESDISDQFSYRYTCSRVARIKLYNENFNLVTGKDRILKISFGIDDSRLSYVGTITNFISLGGIGLSSLSGLFKNSNFNGIIGPNWDTSNIVDISSMFMDARKFNQTFGKNWDTSKICNFSRLLRRAANFNQSFGENWDTSSAIDMGELVSGAIQFNKQFGLTLGKWDVSKVTNFAALLNGAEKFNQIFHGNLDVSNVTSMQYMFMGAKNFNQSFGKNWDTKNLRDVSCMFLRARKFNQPFGFTMGRWDTSKITCMDLMFADTDCFNQPFVFTTGKLDFSCVQSAKLMFVNAVSFNQQFSTVFPENADISDMFSGSGKGPI